MSWRSPTSGRELRAEAPPDAHGHGVLTDGAGERWPMVEGIPYLRVGREALCDDALARLAAGDGEGALVALLADQDEWSTLPVPSEDDRRAALRATTLREGQARLGFGPVGDYFAFRWSDPTFLSGLGLLSIAAPGRRTAFELACGIGHFLRELDRRGLEVAGGDVVFAKLWIARRFVIPAARLACFDAAARFPAPDGAADLALCHDALHYLPDQPHALGELRRIVGPGGAVVAGHVHNAEAENLSPGTPLSPADYERLVPGATFFDDQRAGRALLAGESPPPALPRELAAAPALGFVVDPAPAPSAGTVAPDFSLPPRGSALRLNPLFAPEGEDPVVPRLRWPSERYEREYAALSDHLRDVPPIPRVVLERAQRGALGDDPRIEPLARRRVLVDLPAAW